MIHPERHHILIPDDPDALAAALADVRALAERSGFGDRAADAALAVAELVANAREHGSPPVRVDAWVDGRLVIEVHDGGGGFEARPVWGAHPPAPSGTRGRGLWIVRQLADLVEVGRGPDGTLVRMELTHEPQIGA